MNKNMLYVVGLAVLCVLAGVIVGAGIVKKAGFPPSCHDRASFTARAEGFMGRTPGNFESRGAGRHFGKGTEGKRHPDLIKIFVDKLTLTKEQEARTKEILDRTRQEIDEVGKSVRGAITSIKEKSDKAIMDILTPQQQEKFKAMIEEFEAKKNSGPCGQKGDHGPMGMEQHRMGPDGDSLPPQNE
ncbi:MAG: hypothetical protein PHS46_04735 [Candidatus Omnitrophica bacterium]|nr:hypothetical protein [Candidatus Omnitrophota bacterium]